MCDAQAVADLHRYGLDAVAITHCATRAALLPLAPPPLAPPPLAPPPLVPPPPLAPPPLVGSTLDGSMPGEPMAPPQ